MVGRAGRRLEHRQRRRVEVGAPPLAPRRAEERSQARRHPRRHEHPPRLPPGRLARQAPEPHRELPVGLARRLRVQAPEDPLDVGAPLLQLLGRAAHGHRQRHVAVAHALGLQLDQGVARAPGLDARRGVLERRRRPLLLLHVGDHRVALREVVPLRRAHLPARRLPRPRPPLDDRRHRRRERVQLLQRVRGDRRRRRHARPQAEPAAAHVQHLPLGRHVLPREPPVDPRVRPHPGRPAADTAVDQPATAPPPPPRPSGSRSASHRPPARPRRPPAPPPP